MYSNGCQCDLGYRDNGVAVCEKCNYKCSTCSISPDNCDICADIRFGTSCKCPD